MTTTTLTTHLPLPNLAVARYAFTLRMAEPATLPVHKGALLRGGFGISFKRSVCVYPDLPPCKACLLRRRCAYPPIFEAEPPADATVLRNHNAIPQPFVIVPPGDRQTAYATGDTLTFHVHLFGDAVAGLPYFIVAFQRLGEVGLGRARAHFALQRVDQLALSAGPITPILVDGVVAPGVESRGSSAHDLHTPEPPPADPARLTIRFLSPTALKYEGRIQEGAPPFHILVRTLLRRVSSLSYFYGGQQWTIDYRDWIDRAATVDIADAHIHWHKRSRYSTRKEQRTDLSGITGTVTYRGAVAPFVPLLRLGALCHVGKNAVFGNGRIGVG